MARGKTSPKPSGDMVKSMVATEDTIARRRSSRRRNNPSEKTLSITSVPEATSPSRDEIPSSSPTNNDGTLQPNISPVSPMTVGSNGAIDEAQPTPGHPQAHTLILDLQSDTATSSALPETFGFSISRKGKLVAVYGAKNVWLVHTEQLPRAYMRIFEVRRKPVALDVLDDGSLLAVLSTATKLDVYTLRAGDQTVPQKVKTVYLTNECTCVSLSPNGQVVAAGSKQGVEIISLAASAAEADKRSVLCDSMDSIIFSEDSRTLLATTMARNRKTSTIFTVHGGFDGPFTEEGDPIVVDVDKAWTSQVLFPEKCKRARQATLLPDSTTAQVNELFAYDADQNTWGIYDLSTCRFKESKIFLPERSQSSRLGMLESALPAVSPDANHVAVGVKRERCAEIWLYRLPESLQSGDEVDYAENDPDHCDQDSPQKPCVCVQLPQDEDSKSQEIAALRWLHSPSTGEVERLIAVGSNSLTASPDGSMPELSRASSGVIVVMDFSRANQTSASESLPKRIVFDLDTLLPGERLPDEDIDFEREVEIVRRRTVAQRMAADRAAANARRPSRGIGRSATTASRDSGRRSSAVPSVADDEILQGEEVLAAFEAPYDHTQPRSQASLSRAATVAARSQTNRTHLRALPDRPLEYRRADGLREIPHESDADNWEPPPPPYTPRADPAGPPAMIAGPPSTSSQTQAGAVPASIPPRAVQHAPPLSTMPPLPTAPPVPAIPHHLIPAHHGVPPVPAIPLQHAGPPSQILSPQPIAGTRPSLAALPSPSPQPRSTSQPLLQHQLPARTVPARRPVPASATSPPPTATSPPRTLTSPTLDAVAPTHSSTLPNPVSNPAPAPGAMQARNTFPLPPLPALEIPPAPQRSWTQHDDISSQRSPIQRAIPRAAAPPLPLLNTTVPPVASSNSLPNVAPRNTTRTTPRSRPLIPPSRPLIPPGIIIPQSEPGASPPPLPGMHTSAYLETAGIGSSSTNPSGSIMNRPRPSMSRRAMSRSTTEQRVSIIGDPSPFYMQERRAVSNDSLHTSNTQVNRIQPIRSASAQGQHAASSAAPAGGSRWGVLGRMNTIQSIRTPSIASDTTGEPWNPAQRRPDGSHAHPHGHARSPSGVRGLGLSFGGQGQAQTDPRQRPGSRGANSYFSGLRPGSRGASANSGGTMAGYGYADARGEMLEPESPVREGKIGRSVRCVVM